MAEKNNLAAYFFHQGTNFRAYESLGCIKKRLFDKYVYTFRTWAPNASSVSLVSDFTDWNFGKSMENDGCGVWEVKITSDHSLELCAYKFRIENNGRVFYKGDPYAKFSRAGADGASLIFSSSLHKWEDGAWRKFRRRIAKEKNNGSLSFPMNIYEVHLGSFLRNEDGGFITYREAAETLVPYVKSLGYKHVEFLPLAEHPYDGSWGYQVCAFYAPTSRFGSPDDFRYLIDAFHKCGIGVIMDWVPAHFPKDAWGLYDFDGSALYEYQGKDRIES